MTRVAIYYAPDRDDMLWHAGTHWLGRDPELQTVCTQPDVPGLFDVTASPRRYGFHATLKPPMVLAHGFDRFIDDVRALARKIAPFAAPELTVAQLDGFLAVTAPAPSLNLQALADQCVIDLDHHRVPEPAHQIARRSIGLDDRGRSYVARFGYPYVLDRWQFHMTLTGRLAAAHPVEAAARAYFTQSFAIPRLIGGIAVYREASPGAAFDLVARIKLGG